LLDRGGGSTPFIDAGSKVGVVNIVTGDKREKPYPYALMIP
jgi:hypothetical protein